MSPKKPAPSVPTADAESGASTDEAAAPAGIDPKTGRPYWSPNDDNNT